MLRRWRLIWQRTLSKWPSRIERGGSSNGSGWPTGHSSDSSTGFPRGPKSSWKRARPRTTGGGGVRRGISGFSCCPPQDVRPYVRRNKMDRTDTDAMLDAARCGGMQPVPVKTVEQQTIQTLHRVPTQWHAARTARINVVRGLLCEQGLPVPVGARTVLARVAGILEDAEVALPDLLRHTVALVVDEIRALETRIATIDRQLARVAAEHPVAQRLQHVPGVGVLTATALVGAVNHIHAVRRGREFASWLGLTPRESSTGGRRYLGRISKRGDVDLRCLLTHGARAVLLAAQPTARTAPQRLTRLQQWAVTTAARRGHNKAAIALANTMARIIWAVWHREVDCHAQAAMTTSA